MISPVVANINIKNATTGDIMKALPLIEHSFTKRNIINFSEYEITEVKKFIDWCIKEKLTKSSCQKQIILFCEIIKNNKNCNDYFSLYENYRNSNNQYEKLIIRRGKDAANELKIKYKKRKYHKPLPGTTSFSRAFWRNKGLTEEEISAKFASWSSDNHKKYKNSGKSYRDRNPICIEYWIKRGYSFEESEQLRNQHSKKCLPLLDDYIEKYGHTVGHEKWQKKRDRRLSTLIERYGSTVVSGYTSKESLRFFIPLYKSLRKLGIEKDDICWGISGSREFATRHENHNFFYDFTIKSLKIVIEYNNSFWHARKDFPFENPFITYEESLNKDNLKREIIIERGFDYYVIWNDDNFEEKRKEFINYVKKRNI